MSEVRSRKKRAGTKKKKYNGQQQKEMDYHEPHPAPNEKTQPIQWTERPTGALVAVNSLWPSNDSSAQLKIADLILRLIYNQFGLPKFLMDITNFQKTKHVQINHTTSAN
jgi:hypothetical protein